MANETKIPLFRRFVIQNFPFIEQDFDALTDYQLISKVVEYLNKVIESQNGLVDDMNGLETAFNTLKNYVDHYFDNLDVQEEINNKLDAMAEAGTLQEIIGDYLNATAIWGFNNVNEMKSSTNLINGSYAKTLGFYNLNDGGGATYKIRTVTNDDTVDGMFLVEIGDSANQLVAELIIDNEINIKQLGARPQAQDGTKYDIKNYIDRYINFINEKSQLIKLYIPSGIWYTSGNLLYGKNGFSIVGDETFARFHTYGDGTIITTYSNNQDYIFRLGDASHSCHDWSLKNITFSSADFEYSDGAFNYSTVKTVTKAVELYHAIFGITNNIFFNSINGKAFTIKSSWGNYFNLLNFYKISNENSTIVDFETADTSMGGIIGNTFDKIMFEMCHGHMMSFEDDCRVYNNHFGVIRVEPGEYAIGGREYTTFTSEILDTWDDTTCTHYAILNMATNSKVGENIFDNIEMNNVAHSYYTLNGNKYTYDTVILYANNCYVSNIFTNIANNGGIKNPKIIYLPSTVTLVRVNRSFNTFTNFINPDACRYIFDVNGLNDINLPDNVYLKGDRTLTTYSNQIGDYFTQGGWIPAFKAISKRQFVSAGLGFLYYDADALNSAGIVVKPRTDITDTSFVNTVTNVNKKLYLRAKIPNEAVARLNVLNRTISGNDSFEVTLNGTGEYKVYEIELTNTWNVGDHIRLQLGGTSAEQRVISIDSYLSA